MEKATSECVPLREETRTVSVPMFGEFYYTVCYDPLLDVGVSNSFLYLNSSESKPDGPKELREDVEWLVKLVCGWLDYMMWLGVSG